MEGNIQKSGGVFQLPKYKILTFCIFKILYLIYAYFSINFTKFLIIIFVQVFFFSILNNVYII